MQRVLILDDSKLRHRRLAERLAGFDVTHVYSPHEAIERMRIEKYDLIILDHDLGWYEYPASNGFRQFEITGEAISSWMAQNSNIILPASIVIQSWNSNAKRMKQDLEQAGFYVEWEPFNPGPGSSWFHIGTTDHEKGSSCDGCYNGYPRQCGLCTSYIHAHKSEARMIPFLVYACENCSSRGEISL